MATTYQNIGSVRGWCGHKHRSEQAAIKCQDRDDRDCKRQHGYSDRYTRIFVDGVVEDKMAQVNG